VKDRSARSRDVIGWTAVSISTLISSLWAFWGAIENFHEGWYFREWYRNVALAGIQYLPWMFLAMTAGLVALRRRWLGVAVHVMLATFAVWLFGFKPAAGVVLIAGPLAGLAISPRGGFLAMAST